MPKRVCSCTRRTINGSRNYTKSIAPVPTTDLKVRIDMCLIRCCEFNGRCPSVFSFFWFLTEEGVAQLTLVVNVVYIEGRERASQSRLWLNTAVRPFDAA